MSMKIAIIVTPIDSDPVANYFHMRVIKKRDARGRSPHSAW